LMLGRVGLAKQIQAPLTQLTKSVVWENLENGANRRFMSRSFVVELLSHDYRQSSRIEVQKLGRNRINGEQMPIRSRK
jgi:hypothetical protein